MLKMRCLLSKSDQKRQSPNPIRSCHARRRDGRALVQLSRAVGLDISSREERLEALGKRFLHFIGVNLGKLRPMKFFGNSLKDKLAGIEHFDAY